MKTHSFLMAMGPLLGSRPQELEVLGKAGSGTGKHTLKGPGSYLVLSMQMQCNSGCQSKSHLQRKAGEALFIGAQADRVFTGHTPVQLSSHSSQPRPFGGSQRLQGKWLV